MKNKFIYTFSIAILLSIVMLFSCENNVNNIQIKNQFQKFPMGEAENFELVYTDSTRIKAILTSPKNNDFSNQKFPYTEFPKGLNITLFNSNNEKHIITANYGIYYLKTNIIFLKDSINLTTSEGKILKTNKLYWDENQNWVFTDEPFTFIDTIQKSITKGVGMDFNKEFKRLKAHQITGVLPLKEE